MRSQIQTSLTGRWQADEAASHCNKCRVKFNVFKRRHHCRDCGCIFCSVCSRNKVQIPTLQQNALLRVCDLCFVKSRCKVPTPADDPMPQTKAADRLHLSSEALHDHGASTTEERCQHEIASPMHLGIVSPAPAISIRSLTSTVACPVEHAEAVAAVSKEGRHTDSALLPPQPPHEEAQRYSSSRVALSRNLEDFEYSESEHSGEYTSDAEQSYDEYTDTSDDEDLLGPPIPQHLVMQRVMQEEQRLQQALPTQYLCAQRAPGQGFYEDQVKTQGDRTTTTSARNISSAHASPHASFGHGQDASAPVSLRFLNALQEGLVGGGDSGEFITILLFPGPGKEQTMLCTVAQHETLSELCDRLTPNYLKLDTNPFARRSQAEVDETKRQLRFLTDRHELQPDIIVRELIANNQKRLVLSALPTQVILPGSPIDIFDGNAETPIPPSLTDTASVRDASAMDYSAQTHSYQTSSSAKNNNGSSRSLNGVNLHALTASQRSIRTFLRTNEHDDHSNGEDDIFY